MGLPERVRVVREHGLISHSMIQSGKDTHQRGDTYFRPSVHDVNEVASRTGLPDGLEHLLVLQAPGTEARQGLAAPADGDLGGSNAAASGSSATAPPRNPQDHPHKAPQFTDAHQ